MRVIILVHRYNNNIKTSQQDKTSKEPTVENKDKEPTSSSLSSPNTVPVVVKEDNTDSAEKDNSYEVPTANTIPTFLETPTEVKEDTPVTEKDEISTEPTVEDKHERLSLVGSDVVALFPSIKADTTAKIVMDAIEKSEIQFDGVDYDKARAYVAINIDDIDEDLKQRLGKLIPTRKANTGTRPTMASIGAKWDPKKQWDIEEIELTEKDKKLIIGVVTAIALKVLFNNFTYNFGGKYYHQKAGGPIGVRATGAASELVMEDWAFKYEQILVTSSIAVHLLAGYVDDGRQVTSVISPGHRFLEESGKFEFSQEALQEDIIKKNKGETSNQRMARICVKAMNSINKDLQFTTESQEDFKMERLPTLDFEMWIREDNKIIHSFYQKPMKTPYMSSWRDLEHPTIKSFRYSPMS